MKPKVSNMPMQNGLCRNKNTQKGQRLSKTSNSWKGITHKSKENNYSNSLIFRYLYILHTNKSNILSLSGLLY
jgi:hypothetical protein